MELSPSGEPVDKKPNLGPDGRILSSPPTVLPKTEHEESQLGAGTLTVDQVNIEIIPVIYDIIHCVERESTDNSAKQRDSHEASQKILELQRRVQSAREQIRQLPGIEYNKEEQQQRFAALRNQLRLKQELIAKYKDTQF